MSYTMNSRDGGKNGENGQAHRQSIQNLTDDVIDGAIDYEKNKLEGLKKNREQLEWELKNILLETSESYIRKCAALASQGKASYERLSELSPDCARLLGRDPRFQVDDSIVDGFKLVQGQLTLHLEGPARRDGDGGPRACKMYEFGAEAVGAAEVEREDDPGEGRAHRDVAAARCSLSSTPAPTDDTSQAMDDDATRASRDDTPQWQQRGNSAWEMRPEFQNHHALQPPIRFNVAKKWHYWVFTYRFEEVDSFYIMRCPRPDCDSPVFNRHPLLGDRAAEHLVRCGQPFETERDLVRRYARLVTPTRRDSFLTVPMAKKHNSTLIPVNEQELEEENFD